VAGLADRAIEPNGYYLPDWEAAVNASARGRGGALALTAWGNVDGTAARPPADGAPASDLRLAGLSNPRRRAGQRRPYGPLGTPLLDQDAAGDAVQRMIRQAHDAGIRALILRDIPLQGPVLAAFTHALGADGLRPRVLQSQEVSASMQRATPTRCCAMRSAQETEGAAPAAQSPRRAR